MNEKDYTMIDDIDFAALYQEHIKQSERRGKSATEWDQKAKQFDVTRDVVDPYLLKLIEKMDLSQAQTLLDIGCGPGSICLVLADQFKKIYALDHSQAMLDVVHMRASARNINHIECLHESWDSRGDDSWNNVPDCDVVISSRSSMVADLGDALQKMHAKAKKRAYLTMMVSPHHLPPAVEACLARPQSPVGYPNYIYAINILYQMGIKPELSYITARECQGAASQTPLERWLKDIRWTIGRLTNEEVQRLSVYYAKNQAGIPAPEAREWALISWQKEPKQLIKNH